MEPTRCPCASFTRLSIEVQKRADTLTVATGLRISFRRNAASSGHCEACQIVRLRKRSASLIRTALARADAIGSESASRIATSDFLKNVGANLPALPEFARRKPGAQHNVSVASFFLSVPKSRGGELGHLRFRTRWDIIRSNQKPTPIILFCSVSLRQSPVVPPIASRLESSGPWHRKSVYGPQSALTSAISRASAHARAVLISDEVKR